MITASGEQEKLAASRPAPTTSSQKPFEQSELLARVQSLLRIKRYHDTIESQAAELAAWNRELEQRVSEQVDELERHGPAQALPVAAARRARRLAGDESFLQSHRREITVVFCDLRGFTQLRRDGRARGGHGVLGEYHAALGDLVHRFDGTLERFTGDGMMVIFNDPLRLPRPPSAAVRMSLAIRRRIAELAERWTRKGYDLGSASASRRATRPSAGSASRGAPTTPPSAG